MTTTQTGVVNGRTIELEGSVPELDGQRVRVVLESFDERRLTAQEQDRFWQAWVEKGPDGPIENGTDTDLP